MGTVLVLHKRNKMQHKNRPHVAPMLQPELLHNLPCPHAPFLFVSDCPGRIKILSLKASEYDLNDGIMKSHL